MGKGICHKTSDLSSIPRDSFTKGRANSLKLSPDLHMYAVACVLLPTPNNTYSKFFKNLFILDETVMERNCMLIFLLTQVRNSPMTFYMTY